MAVSMAFPGQVFGSNACSKPPRGLPFPVYKGTGRQMHALRTTNKMLALKYNNRGNTARMRPGENHRFNAVISSSNNSNSTPSDTIEQFYECINNKNVTKLGKYLANDCAYEDFSFPKPFQGKKEVLNYFQQLTKCMGENIEFNVEIISKGDDDDHFTIAVYWHLDWNNIQIPFTKGISLFVLSKGTERPLIKKARVVVEPPLKPGSLALNFLKIVTSVFDAFPEATKWFLRSPHVILHRIYSLVLAPFIKPMLACYINLWKFIVITISFAFNMYLQISKLFKK